MQNYNVVIAFYDGRTYGVTTRRIRDHEDLNRYVPVNTSHYRKLYSVLDENNGVALLVDQLDYTTFMKFSVFAALGHINGTKTVTLLFNGTGADRMRGMVQLTRDLNELGIPAKVQTDTPWP